MDKYSLLKQFLKNNKSDTIIFDLAEKMFKEGKSDPVFILTHIIIYQYNLLKNQELMLKQKYAPKK